MTGFIEISAISPVADHLRLEADVNTSSSSLADVSGMSFVLEENSFYEVMVTGLFQTAATTTGIKVGATVPTGSTINLLFFGPTTAANTAWIDFQNGTTAASTTTPGVVSANVDFMFMARFLITTGAESGSPSTGIVGAFQLRFASEVAASATLREGTCMVLRKFSQPSSTAAVTLQSPGFNSSYSSSDVGVGPRSATLKLTYKTDGTWTITSEPDDSISGSPVSGNWGTPTTSGAGANYEVRFTASGQVGGSVSNSASDWTTLSSNVFFSINANSVGGLVTGDVTVTAEVRQKGTTAIDSTGSTALSVTANTLSGE